MDTSFAFLGLTVHAYGLYAAAAALLLLVPMGLLGRRNGLPAGTVRMFGLLGIALGVVGARAVYCVFNLPAFLETYENPWLMLRFFDGGLAMPGLLAGLALAALLAARLMKAQPGALLDVMCVPMGLMLAALRFGEQFTDLGVGKAIEEGWLTAAAPWLFEQSRMGVAMEYRLNVWAYEAAAGIVLFAATLLAYLWLRGRREARPGDTALCFFSLYGASQTLLESMRDDGHMMIVFLRIGQVAAALCVLIACGVWLARYTRICGRANARVWLTVGGMILYVAGVALLEFSLDGRLTFGAPSLARDYGLMAALCGMAAALACSLMVALNRRLYRESALAQAPRNESVGG